MLVGFSAKLFNLVIGIFNLLKEILNAHDLDEVGALFSLLHVEVEKVLERFERGLEVFDGVDIGIDEDELHISLDLVL